MEMALFSKVVILLLVYALCAVGWFAKHANTQNRKDSSHYLKDFLEEMKADQIREHLR